jgi:Fe-S cluster assembly iron-binding protein IscA
VLTLTENASTIVRDITNQIHEDPNATPDEAGLRITTDDTPEPAFAISASEGPQPGDAKVEQDGATVYLDGLSAAQLDDKVLDASLDPAGNVQFALGEQV